jgi:hypothetical protein
MYDLGDDGGDITMKRGSDGFGRVGVGAGRELEDQKFITDWIDGAI